VCQVNCTVARYVEYCGTVYVSVAAFVTSTVHRCNSLLVGTPKSKCLLDCLQSVLNTAARLLCNRRKYDHRIGNQVLYSGVLISLTLRWW